MENVRLLLELLLAGGLITLLAVGRKVYKEINDVVKVWKKANEDGKINDKEMAQIGKEAIEALIEIRNFWKALKKTFGKMLKK